MRRSFLSHQTFSLFAVIAAIIVTVCPINSVLACGNVNGLGGVDLTDLSSAVSYLSGGGFIIPNYGNADMDNHYLYTMMDLALLSDVAYHPNVGVCPPALGPLDPPLSASDYMWYDRAVLPANQGNLALSFGFGVSDTCDYVYFPVMIRVDGAIPIIDSAKSDFFTPLNNVPEGKISFRKWYSPVPSVTHPKMTNPAGTIYFHLTPSVSPRPITVTFDPDGPIQDGYKVSIPMVITTWPERAPKTPTLKYCCTGGRGNVNMEGIVDLADLALLVSFLTQAGVILPCEDQANANGVGIVDLADLSLLVQYLTSSGVTLAQCP